MSNSLKLYIHKLAFCTNTYTVNISGSVKMLLSFPLIKNIMIETGCHLIKYMWEIDRLEFPHLWLLFLKMTSFRANRYGASH